MSQVRAKICGLKTSGDVNATAKAGAAYAGFNFFAKSPRSVTVETAAQLSVVCPVGLCKVGLVVDVSNDFLDLLTADVPLDMLQLHGGETPQRVAEIKARYGLPVMKVIGVSGPEDIETINTYMEVADQILVDAKAPKDAVLPGGNGISFDWSLLAGKKYWQRPWMLAGGLTPENVGEAIRKTGATQVDVASGVERTAGEKSPELIEAFVSASQSV